MDPNAALANLKDAIKETEALMRAAEKASTKSEARRLNKEAGEPLDDAGQIQTDIVLWISAGGFKPRGFDTWRKRYVEVLKDWYRQGIKLK